MANTIIASAVLPGSIDTPLDARSRVDGIPDILEIENPYVGQLVYCRETETYYVVTRLKPKQIGVFLVENAAVDTYKELSPQRGIDYWTETDKEEIRNYVVQAILTGEW